MNMTIKMTFNATEDPCKPLPDKEAWPHGSCTSYKHQEPPHQWVQTLTVVEIVQLVNGHVPHGILLS